MAAGKDGAPLYAIAKVATPGSATLRISEEHEAAVTFEVVEPDSVDALRHALSCIPRLHVFVDDTHIEPWREYKGAVVIQRRPAAARVDMGGLPARVNVVISGNSGRRIWTRLKPSEAAEVITAAVNEGVAIRIEVDSGGLGHVAFDARHRARDQDPRDRLRTRGWLRNVSFATDPAAAMAALGVCCSSNARATYALSSRSRSVVGAHLRALMHNRKATPHDR